MDPQSDEDSYITHCAIYQSCYESELAEKLALLEAITHKKQVFWCCFCLRASSALRGNKCPICKQEIPCATWCSDANSTHLKNCHVGKGP